VKKLGIPMLMFVAMLGGTVLGLAACKQGEGERCQVNDDCDSGLVCNQATGTCARQTEGDIDADVPPQIDAPPVDAVDAPPDAPDAN
jgi:hypothetical protein